MTTTTRNPTLYMKKSLGTVSALMSLCAASQSVNAATVASTSINNNVVVANTAGDFSNISQQFDFNDDAVMDFEISSVDNDATLLVTPLNGASLVIDSGTGHMKELVVGDTIDSGSQFFTSAAAPLHTDSNTAISLIKEGTFYFGLREPGPSGYFNAWVKVQVDLDAGTYDENFDSVILLSSSWDNTPNGSITIVPEPSSSLLAMAGVMSLGLIRRRKK